MLPLHEIIHQLWKTGNDMPSINRRPTPSQVGQQAMSLLLGGDALDGGVPATSLSASRITAVVYGRNGVGKTTFACQGEGPTALISIEPSPTGGARSVSNRPDITVYQRRSSAEVLAIADALRARFASGQTPFRKVVIDGISSWNDVILSEVLGLTYAKMPVVLGLGKVSADQYIERGERLVRYLKPFFDLPCDVWLVAQERDHNPPKDKTTTRSGKEFSRPSQTPFMREAHPMAQEGSFFSLGVADTPAKFVQDACDNVLQLYEDNEWREEKGPDLNLADGTVLPGAVLAVPTGRRVKRLRCVYHPNYAARVRAPVYRNVPEYIEAPTPEERYQAFLDVVAGKRTKWGYYPPAK